MNKHQWAQHWAAEGYHVFPVSPMGKKPLIDDWPNLATCDTALLAAWWDRWPDANIGVCPGASGHVVIDADVKREADGMASLALLELELGDLPADTLTVRTGSGGLHIWLSVPGSASSSAGKLGPGLDTRGRGGYVLMPGSVTDAGEYSVVVEAAPAPAPAAWADRLRNLSAAHERREATAPVEADTPAVRQRVRQHLDALVAAEDVAVSGQGGNSRTYQCAAALRDMGASEGAAAEALLAHWNPHCRPPWPETDLIAIVQNAYRYAQNDAGAKTGGDTDGSGFGDIASPEPQEAPPARRSRFAVLSIPDLEALPEPAWLIPGWLPLYVTTILYGRPGSMKSFAALDAALAVAHGRPAWGLEYAATARPVVYVAGEGQIGLAKQRVPAWIEHHGGDRHAPFRMVMNAPRASNLDEDLRDLFAAIEEASGDTLPRLVVYDTHARIMSGLDENSAQDTSRALDLYDATTRRYSCAVLALHHTGKAGDGLRGSTALLAGVDVALGMEREAGVAILKCDKIKDAENPKPIAFAPVYAGRSIVLARSEHSFERHAPSQIYVDAVGVLTRNGAHDLASAMTTAALAAEMPAVLECEGSDAQEAARRTMQAELTRRARNELRALACGAVRGMWALPVTPH